MDNKIAKALFEKPMLLHIDFTEKDADLSIGVFWVILAIAIIII